MSFDEPEQLNDSACLNPEDWKRAARVLDDLLEDTHSKMRNGRVTPDFDLRKFAEELLSFDFINPIKLENLLPWVIERMRDGNVQITHPRYFGLFNPARAAPALLAERVVASLNIQLVSADMSPAAAALEAHVIAQFADRIGFPPISTGHFTHGGSEANFAALICALTDVNPAFSQIGARAYRVPPTMYISQDAHPAWLKLAHQAGIGHLAVRKIETDGNGRMSSFALRSAVESDIDNGLMPVMVVGTAGTAQAGMVDPLVECADVANQSGAWFHVDAGWGGIAIASNHTRKLLAGIEFANSVTIDAQRFSATTTCGMFISRKPVLMHRVFGMSEPFTLESGWPQDLYGNTLSGSRRFLGLLLFMNLTVSGWNGHAQHVERTLSFMKVLRKSLEALDWKIVNPDALGVLCVKPPEGFQPVRRIVDECIASGQAWISTTVFEGVEAVRICIPNSHTETSDIHALVEILTFYGEMPNSRRVTTN